MFQQFHQMSEVEDNEWDAVEAASPRPSLAKAAPATAQFGATSNALAHKSPIRILHEKYPGLSIICTYGDGSPLSVTQPLQLSHSMRYKAACNINSDKFEGYGSSMKQSKLVMANKALAVLEGKIADAPRWGLPTTIFLSQNIADHITKLVNEKFYEVMRGDVVHCKWKVLAGIVITIGNGVEDAKVIAVTTGTKCVSGEHISIQGRVLNDCHAEVTARRCLQRHLYAQLLMYASVTDPGVPIPESDVEPCPGGGYQLKPDRQVHLYVSTAPCGDGAIFSPHEQLVDKHPNRLARGQLRTKIEGGLGTIPLKKSTNVVQTWDGVLQGDQLLTMSCSDKVARWCVVGMQGALLSRLLRPVYLHSLVLGSLFHPQHLYRLLSTHNRQTVVSTAFFVTMTDFTRIWQRYLSRDTLFSFLRALCGRFENHISSLPTPFRLHRPLLARPSSPETRKCQPTPTFSVGWCSTTPLPEVVIARTGKLENGQPSLLCKQIMFARWQYLVRRLPQLPQEPGSLIEPVNMPSNMDTLTYDEAKQLCPSYQVAKDCLIDAFDKAKLGRWIKKPLEQDQFLCEILDADPKALFA